MSKAEMKLAWDEYQTLLRASRDAYRAGDWQASLQSAVQSLPYVDGMMQYGRKYEQLEFRGITENDGDARGDQVPAVSRHGLQQIETNRVPLIGGVEIHDVIGPPGRNVIEQIVSEIAVRINHSDAATGFDVLLDERAKQRAFPRAGLANEVGVMPAVRLP